MDINACIFDKEHNLEGCITDSVIEHFELQFNSIKEKNYDVDVTCMVGLLEKMLIKSKDKMTADFLNCLKLIYRKYKNSLPEQFAQDLSRSYHNLVRYCTSTIVYNEVFEKTLQLFRNAGIEYHGKNIEGVAEDECAFNYEGLTIGIKLCDKKDLYGFWNKDFNTQAVIYDGDKKYIVINSLKYNFIDAIKACVEDSKNDFQNVDNKSLAEQLIDVAKKLLERCHDDY